MGRNKTPEQNRKDRITHFLKKGVMLPPDTPADLAPYKEPLEPVDEGFGYKGTLAHSKDGTHVQCHVCGFFFNRLAAHTKRQHGLTASEYKEKFQLSKGTGLLSREGSKVAKAAQLKVDPAVKAKRLEMFNSVRHKREYKRGIPNRNWSLERKNKEGRCYYQLLDKIETLAGKLGKTPTRREFGDEYGEGFLGSIYNTFGSWNQAVTFANLTPNQRGNNAGRKPFFTRDSVIAMMRNFYEVTGEVPRTSDLGNLLPSYPVIKKLFGGMIQARKAAGFGLADYVTETGREYVKEVV